MGNRATEDFLYEESSIKAWVTSTQCQRKLSVACRLKYTVHVEVMNVFGQHE